jgi:hypothetical protein
MKANHERPAFSRCVLAALFSGIIATCIGLLYDIVYRGITEYNPSFIINVPSIIFGTLVASLAAGVIFYLCISYIKGGVQVFRIFFLALSALLAFVAFRSHYGGNLPAFRGFSGLLFGIDAILAVFIIVLIPYFFRHNKIFMD